MKELYFISCLDGLSLLFGVALFLSAACAVLGAIAYSVCIADPDMSIDPAVCRCAERNKGYHKLWKTLFKSGLCVAIFSLFGCIFIPDTKHGYMIYGVGSTLDYIKADSTAVQLPHKAIEAIDLWVNEIMSNDNNSK